MVCQVLAPSIAAASSISIGTSRTKPSSSQMQYGSVYTWYTRISPGSVFSSPNRRSTW
jgi:hypothetical protein